LARVRGSLLRTAAVLLGVAFFSTGCGSSSGPTIPKSALSKLVLQAGDLPKAFSIFYFGHQLSADQTGARSDPERFGRSGGWIGRYHRGGTSKTKGPLVISSRVDLFKDTKGAKSDLELYRLQLARLGGSKPVDVGKLGDQAIGVTTLQEGAVSVRSYAIAWRERNATGELELNGFEGKLTLAEALALARKQDSRLRDAAR
jgi:hypothetical protein